MTARHASSGHVDSCALSREQPQAPHPALCARGEALESKPKRREDALSAFEWAWALFEVGARPGIAFLAAGRMAMVLLRLKRPDEARAVANEALREAQGPESAADLHRGLGSLHGVLARLERGDERYDDALRHLEAAERHLEKARDPDAMALNAIAFGNLAQVRGDFERALQSYRAAAQTCRRLGLTRGVGIACNNAGELLVSHLERYEEAIPELNEAVEAFRRMDAHEFRLGAMESLTGAHLSLGRWPRARETAESGRDLATSLEWKDSAERFSQLVDDALAPMLDATIVTE